MKVEAEKAWNHARSFEHEAILDTNIIVNKGIWQSMIEIIKNNRTNNV